MRFSNREDNNNLINHINLESDFSFFGSLEGLSWESNLWINTADHLTDKWGSGSLREFFPGRTLNSPIISSCFSLSLKTTVRSQTGWKSQLTAEKTQSNTGTLFCLRAFRFWAVSVFYSVFYSFIHLFMINLIGSYFYIIFFSAFRWLFFKRKTIEKVRSTTLFICNYSKWTYLPNLVFLSAVRHHVMYLHNIISKSKMFPCVQGVRMKVCLLKTKKPTISTWYMTCCFVVDVPYISCLCFCV